MQFLATWGWIICAVLVIGSILLINKPAKIVIAATIVGIILYIVAGFDKDFFNPKELHMETMFAFVAGILVGGWGWIILAVLVCSIFPLVEYEREGWAFLLVLFSAVMLYLVTGWNLFILVLYHPLWVLPVFIAYLAVGVAWGLWVKWPRFIDKAIERTRAAELRFIKKWIEVLTENVANLKTKITARQSGSTERRERHIVTWTGAADMSPEEQNAAMEKMLSDLGSNKIPDELLQEWLMKDESRQVSVFQNKERFLNWVMFWPWSALAYFFFDFVREIIENIWKQLISTLQAVVDRKYSTLDQRLIKKPALE